MGLSDKTISNIILSEYGDVITGEQKVWKPGDIIEIKKQDGDVATFGYVDQLVKDDRSGQLMYTVTKERIDPSLSEAEKMKLRGAQDRVTVLVQGSEGLGSMFGDDISKRKEVIKDWLVTDIPIGLAIFNPLNSSYLDSTPVNKTIQEYLEDEENRGLLFGYQLRTSLSAFDNQIINEYPNAQFLMFGHSLGSMIIQYITASTKYPERIHSAFVAEGPNIFSLLNGDLQKQARTMRDKVVQYVDPRDMVPIGFGKNKEAIGQVVMLHTRSTGTLFGGEQHMMKGYLKDAQGNFRIMDSEEAANYRLRMAKYYLQNQGYYLNERQRRYVNMGGKNPVIFLKYDSALFTFRTLKVTVMTNVLDLKDETKASADLCDEYWKSCKAKAYAIGDPLSASECLNALAEVGANDQTMLTQYTDFYNSLLSQVSSIDSKINTLIANAEQGMNGLLEQDGISSMQLEQVISW